MTYPFVVAVDNEGPTSEYVVEIDQDLAYTFMLTAGDAEAIEDQTPIEPTDLPTISALDPSTAVIGGPVFALAVTGTGFKDDSQIVIVIDGEHNHLPSTVTSETSITADIDPASATAGNAPVYVSVGIGESNELPFTFTASE